MNMMFVGYRGLDLYNENGNLVEKGPVYSDGSVTPDILRFELERIGYHTLEPRVLNVADYGVLQKRKSVIFIGYRRDVVAPTYPEPTIIPNISRCNGRFDYR